MPVAMARVSVSGGDVDAVIEAVNLVEQEARRQALQVLKRPAPPRKVFLEREVYVAGLVLVGGRRGIANVRKVAPVLEDVVENKYGLNRRGLNPVKINVRPTFTGIAGTTYHRIYVTVYESPGENKYRQLMEVVDSIRAEAVKYGMQVVGPITRPVKSFLSGEVEGRRPRTVEMALRAPSDVVERTGPRTYEYRHPINKIVELLDKLPQVRRAPEPPVIRLPEYVKPSLPRWEEEERIEYTAGEVQVVIERVKGTWTRYQMEDWLDTWE